MRRLHRSKWLMVLAAFALIVAACGDEEAEETTTTAAPATTTTAAATTTTEAGEEPVFFVTFNIHPDAAWADGVPVTADDFIFTWETIMNPDFDITSREGFNKIITAEAIDDKTVRFGYSEIYAPWQNQWTQSIFPKHELEGKDFDEVWNEEITLGSGPFVFESWTKDQNITLVRSDIYWNQDEAGGDVQEIVIPFIEESQTQVAALRGREIDMFYPQPQLDLLQQVDAIAGVTSEVGAGPVWEHFDFNHDDPLLANAWMRQAVAMGIDRESIVEAIIRPLRPEAEVLQNVIWMTGTANYEDHFSQWDYDPVAAEALLVDNGCVKGGDGIYECDGVRASFEWATTAGNEARELQFEIAQATLKEVGIEVTADFGPASEVFADEHFFGGPDAWQIFNFAWVGSPDPAGGNTIYYCEGEAPSGFGDLNNLRYCNEQVDALIRSTDTIADPAERAAVYNQADELIAADMAQLPLYQKPTFFAWYDDISGPKDNATQIGPFWNVEEWTGKDTIIFGADQQPAIMNNTRPDGNLFANGLIAQAILQGAYTVTPDFVYTPELIVSAETEVVGG